MRLPYLLVFCLVLADCSLIGAPSRDLEFWQFGERCVYQQDQGSFRLTSNCPGLPGKISFDVCYGRLASARVSCNYRLRSMNTYRPTLVD